MATVNWNSGVSGNWATGSDWSTGSAPGAGDIVSIGVGGTYTVTVAAAAAAYSLSISDPSASLDLAANLTLSGGLSDSQSLIDIAAGSLAVTGGAVVFGENTNVTGASVDGPGTLSTAAGVTATIDTGYNTGNGGLVTSLILGGGVTWSNSGTVADTGQIRIGDGSGETAKIVNNAGGVFQFDTPFAQIYDNSNATCSFSNAGTIDVGTSTYFAPLLTNTSTGVIDLQSGTLDLQASSTIGGTVTGGGVLQFNGGNSTITAATSGNLLVTGGDLTLAETANITGNVSETSGGIYLSASGPTSETLVNGFADSQGQVALASGRTFALTGGTVTFGENTNVTGAIVDGPGTLSTAAGVTATIDTGYNTGNGGLTTSLILGGGVTWSNSGTVADTGHIQIGDGSGETAKIVNNAGGVFQFDTPFAQVYDNSNATGSFSNAGTIDVGINTYFAPLLTNTSTGVIDLQSGTLDLQGSNTIGGTVTGGGVLQFNGGNSTITAATSGNLLVTGGDLTLAEAASITGNVSETSGGIYLSASGPTSETLVNGFADSQGQVAVASGCTLALTGGTVTFGENTNVTGASVDGPGTLSTATAVTTTIDTGYNTGNGGLATSLILGGGVTWSNSGTVADTGQIQIGDGSGETAKIVNNAGGVFQFEAPFGKIYNNSNATGSFSNAGTIDVGTSTYFAPLLTNTSTGVIDLQSGTLDLQASSTIGGTVTGGGVLQFNGGNSTITAATSGNLLVTGGDLTLAETANITGNVSETSGGIYLSASGPTSETLVNGFADSQGQVALASGRTFALTGGTVTFGENTNVTGAIVDGPGTLSTAAGVTATIDTGYNTGNGGLTTSLILGGGVTWSNSGTVADTGHIQIGDGSGETAKIVNNAGGVFEFEAPYAQIYNNTNATGSFSNAGTIDVGTNTNFSPLLTNTATGVIDLQAGTLDLQADAKIGGTVTGGGTLEFSGSGNSTITAVTSGNLLVAGGVLTLAEARTISGSITETGGTVIVGKNLTLTGVLQDQGGLLQISGDTLTGKVVTTSGSGTISGYGSITGAVNNNGTVVAGQGQLTLGTGASGSGVFNIAAAGSLEFSGSATAVKIGFLSGGGETLLLAKPGAVSGTISGFGTNDSIDLLNTAATGLTYANGTLTVTGSTGTLATLDFSGSYVQANFSLQSDDIVFQPTAQSIAHLLPSGTQPEHQFVADSQHAYSSIGAPDMHDLAALFGHHIKLG